MTTGDEIEVLPRYRCPDPQCQALVECYQDGNLWRFDVHYIAHVSRVRCRCSYTVAQGVEPMR